MTHHRSILSLVAAEGEDRALTLIERAYLQMQADIIDGKLAPGQKLRVEHLKACYGVGAGTLREAITRLVSDAMVVAEGHKGFRVAPIALEDLEDLTRMRLHIEIDALRQSIRYGDENWRANLQRAYNEVSAFDQPLVAENRFRWELLNSRFHEALIAGRSSPWTLNIFRTLAQHGERYRRYTMRLPDSRRDFQAEHCEIFELAMAGQEARAALALDAHISHTLNILRLAQEDGIDVFRSVRDDLDAG